MSPKKVIFAFNLPFHKNKSTILTEKRISHIITFHDIKERETEEFPSLCSSIRQKNVYLSQKHSQLNTMKINYKILLSVLLLTATLHAKEIPIDTLLTRFYIRAATLMEKEVK